MKNSMMRWMTLSAMPPKYPEIPPSVMPSRKAKNTPTRPTVIDTRVP